MCMLVNAKCDYRLLIANYLVVEVVSIAHMITRARAALNVFMDIYRRRPLVGGELQTEACDSSVRGACTRSSEKCCA